MGRVRSLREAKAVSRPLNHNKRAYFYGKGKGIEGREGEGKEKREEEGRGAKRRGKWKEGREEREDEAKGKGRGKGELMPPHDLFAPSPCQYIASIAAAEKRPLSYQTPQSVHMVRNCAAQTMSLTLHYGGKNGGK